MFDKLKRFFDRKAASPASPASPAMSPATTRQAAIPPAPQPQMATSRLQEPATATRGRSAAIMGAPSSESVMAAKRQATSATSPAGVPPPASDHRRTQKSYQRGDRVNAKDFMAIATADGSRGLRTARTREVILKTRQGETDGMTMRHRSGSVTELHLAPDSSQVMSAKHYSKTTGTVSEVREKHMRGPAQKQLTKAASRKDHR